MKLSFQHQNSVGWGQLSILIAFASFSSGPPQSRTVTAASVLSFGQEGVGINELYTATEVVEILASGALGAAANFEAAFGIVFSY